MAEGAETSGEVVASQALRLQERLDRQLAGTRRELEEMLERTVEGMVQERIQAVRNQVLVNHTVLQNDVASLQTSLSELRLHVIAASHDSDDHRHTAAAAAEEASKSCKSLQSEIVGLRAESEGLALRVQAEESAVSEARKVLQAQSTQAVEAQESVVALFGELRTSMNARLTELRTAVDVCLSDASSAQALLVNEATDGLATRFTAQLSELTHLTTARLEACDGLCNRCLYTLDVSLGELRREFAALTDKSVASAEAEIQANCRQLSVSALAEAESQAGAVRQWAEELIERHSVGLCKLEEDHQRHRECHSELQCRLREELRDIQSFGVHEADVSQRAITLFGRRLTESVEYLEARGQATQSELCAAEDRLLKKDIDTAAKTDEFARSLRHLEQATAWLLRKLDESQEADAKSFWQEKITEVHAAHESLKNQQVVLESRQQSLEELQASQKLNSAQSVDRVSEDLRSARGEFDGQLAAARQSLEAVLEEVSARLPRASCESNGPAVSAAAVEEATAAAVRAGEEQLTNALSMAREQQDKAQRKFEDGVELRTAVLTEKLRLCVSGQQEQEGNARDLQGKLGRLESESMVALQQVRQDLTSGLAILRSQLWEERGAVEARLQDCGAVQDGLANQNQYLASQLDASEKRLLAEQGHLAAELNVSETRLLTENRAILAQVHEIAKAQESRMHRHSAKSHARYEEAAHGWQEMRQEVMDATRQLAGGLFAEQTSLAAALQGELREAKSVASSEARSAKDAAVHVFSAELRQEVAAREVVVQALSAELRGEVAAREVVVQAVAAELQEQVGVAQDLAHQLSATHDASIEHLHLRLDSCNRQGEELAALDAKRIAEERARLSLEADRSAEEHARLKEDLCNFEQDAHCRGQAEASLEREACMAACRRVAMECAAVERVALVEQRAVADKAGAVEESVEAMRKDIVSVRKSAMVRQDVEAVRKDIEAIRGEVLADTVAAHGEIRADLRAIRSEVLQELTTTEASCRTNAEGLHNEIAERYCTLDEAVSRLESSSSGGAIAAAAASAAVEVRNEVIEIVCNLHERMAATDEQLLFIRGEVAPDVLRGVLRRDLASSMEQTAADQLARFRKRWGGDVERKLDCVVQCLRSLYLKLGLPPHGALSLLPPASQQLTEFENVL